MNHTGKCPSQVPSLGCQLPLPAWHRGLLHSPCHLSIHQCELAEALIRGGHEAVLDAEDDEGIVAACGFLLQ